MAQESNREEKKAAPADPQKSGSSTKETERTPTKQTREEKKQTQAGVGVFSSDKASADPSVGLRVLYSIVFASGAALMAFEMTGVRLIEPFFGSTIYVWGSIIGVFMGALSIGYWGGGRLADRSPSLPTLGAIFLISSLLTLVVPLVAPYICTYLSSIENVDVRYRTLLASLILFAPGSIGMGMASPFAIRLAARQMEKVGAIAGSLYAVSTLGSIVGTFLVSFFVVEFMGSSATVYAVGLVLAGIAVFCFFRDGGRYKRLGTVAALIGALLGFVGARSNLTLLRPGEKLIEVRESAYHHIAIVRGNTQLPPYKLPAILMLFNNQIESGIELDPATGEIPPGPARTACGYVNLLHLGMAVTGQAPKRILVIGCGGGVGPRMFKEYYPDSVERIDVVDIDPWVFRMAEKYFQYPFSGDPVIKSHVADGRMFVAQADPNERWDYIIMDAYTTGGRIPKHLITEEFFNVLKSRLTPDGVLVANIISALEKPSQGLDHSRLFRSVYKTQEKVFDSNNYGGGNLYVFPRHRSLDVGENIIMVASQAGNPRYSSVDIDRRYRRLRGELFAHLDLDSIVSKQLTSRPELDDVPILTDDFCPTDSMVHR